MAVTDANVEPDPSPAPYRRKLIVRVLLGVLAALAVVALILGIVYGPTAWRISQQRDPKLDTPAQIGDLRRDDGDAARETVEYIRVAAEAAVDFDRSFGVVYNEGTPGGRSVLIVGGTVVQWSPVDSLDELFTLITDDSGGVDAVRDLPPGALGGVVRCGRTTTESGDLAVCGWSDHGSAAVALLPGRSLDEASALFPQIRTAVEHRD